MFFLALLVLSSIGFIATDVYLPSLPSIVQELSATKGTVQLTLSFYLLSFGGSQIFFGPLSERIGRKKVTLLGLFFMLLGSAVCSLSPNISTLIVGRFMEGLGVGAASSVFRAILRDVYFGDTLSQRGSYISVWTAFCMSAAPLIGGYIQHYFGWRFNFVFMLLYTLFVIIMIVTFLPETHKKLDPNATKIFNLIHRYKTLLKSRVFIGYAACGTFTFGGLSAYLAVGPFLFQNVVGLTPIDFGWLAIFIAVGLALGALINNFSIPKFGRHKILRFGTFLQILSGIAMLIPALLERIDVFAIMLPMLLYMVGAGLVFSNAFAGAFHFFSKISGFTGALYGCLQILGGTLAAAIMAFLHAQNQIPLAVFLLLVGFFNFFFQRLGHSFTLKCEENQIT